MPTVELQQMRDEIAHILGATDETARLAMLQASLSRHGCSTLAELRAKVESLWRIERALTEYNDIFERMKGEDWFIFMNHGYAPMPDEAASFPVLRDTDDAWRHQAYLYCHLMNAAMTASDRTTLEDCDLLDVGCGRGGGLSVIKRYYRCKRAVGVDINPLQIAFCMDRHRDVGIEFVEANALAIPFGDRTFDLIVNVESSHYYPDMGQFLAEVRRVLRPGGLLLLTDVHSTRHSGALIQLEVLNSGMQLVSVRDITDRVREACSLDAVRFRTGFNSEKAEFPRRIAETRAGTYASGRSSHVTYVVQKN